MSAHVDGVALAAARTARRERLAVASVGAVMGMVFALSARWLLDRGFRGMGHG